MSQTTNIVPHSTESWADYREVMRADLPTKRWHQLAGELEQLYRLPNRIRLMPGNSGYDLLCESWSDSYIAPEPLLMPLVYRLTDVFTASPGFHLIAQRFGAAPDEVFDLLQVHNMTALAAFWAYRRFPYLSREIFTSKLKCHFSRFKAIPLRQFFGYAPCFVLGNLKAVLQSQESVEWVYWIVSGKNIRHAPGLPFPLTRKMAHWMTQAPHNLDFEEAFFYGQVRGLGGSEALYNRLQIYYNQYFSFSLEFRPVFIRFMMRHGHDVASDDLSDLIGYLQHSYQESEDKLHFHPERRSLPVLLRDMEQWYTEMTDYERENFIDTSWTGATYRAFESQQGEVVYRIIQLTTFLDLHEEGVALRHCVSSYVENCLEGSCSIWSLRRYESPEKATSLVTIEVDPNGEIIQAMGMKNAHPKAEEIQLIRRWAAAEGLKINNW